MNFLGGGVVEIDHKYYFIKLLVNKIIVHGELI